MTATTLNSPVGPLRVRAGARGVQEIAFATWPIGPAPDTEIDTDVTALAVRQLTEYFEHRRTEFDLPIDWSAITGFRAEVLRALHETVPFGETTTYGGLAQLCGRPDAVRVVGTIMGSNPVPIVVPCHRVLASNGMGGFGPGLEAKRRLLVLEGVLPPGLDDLDLL
ncbi:methylated-DNA--[protein]-cysteine S-methyltransferase [Pseudonocardiaceae bacterium YIM PH 21723]|nr:methylated-DNA--[protein]-cysteine S-methyltransferase [Pseudonocardiaceae bacterium YIM PH 21723]